MRRTSYVAALLLLVVVPLALPCEATGQVVFRGVPPARSVAEAHARMAQRVERVLAHFRARPLTDFGAERTAHGSFLRPALARLEMGEGADAINRALLSPLARPFGAYGSSVRVIPGLCSRTGDYDFVAQGLVRLAHRHGDALWPASLRRLANELLPERGARPRERFRLGLCGTHSETENHVVLTESSRYLTNQLLRRLGYRDERLNNRTSGLERWLLERLRRTFVSHFEEYNARPYQGYTVSALENLHDFAESPDVARAAGMVLDYLSAVFAVQSNGLRRFPPFRRQERYLERPRLDDHDTETARFALLAGNYELYEPFGYEVPYGDRHMLSAALSSYRPDDAILDLIIDKRHNRYFQRLRHDNVELYASSENILISAGGVFVRHFQFGSNEQHGWARPTVVMPTRSNHLDVRTLLRIEGAIQPRARNNTCVLPGFACGLNVRIPIHIPARCRERHGSFVFLDLSKPRCNYGFYAAVYQEPCDSARCRRQATDYGFWEVREATELSFRAFVAAVLGANGGRVYHSNQRASYTTSDGRSIVFEPLSDDLTRWPIVSVGAQAQDRRFARWPLAQGDIINARGDGLIELDNPPLATHIELDLRQPTAPVKRVQRHAPHLAASRARPAAVGERR